MTLDQVMVLMGLGILMVCVVAGVTSLIRSLLFRSGREDRRTDAKRRADLQDRPRRSRQQPTPRQTQLPSANAAYRHALSLLEQGVSAGQVRNQVGLPQGELELLVRMQRGRASFSAGTFRLSA